MFEVDGEFTAEIRTCPLDLMHFVLVEACTAKAANAETEPQHNDKNQCHEFMFSDEVG
jgi:hypothetical protein